MLFVKPGEITGFMNKVMAGRRRTNTTEHKNCDRVRGSDLDHVSNNLHVNLGLLLWFLNAADHRWTRGKAEAISCGLIWLSLENVFQNGCVEKCFVRLPD